MSHPNDDPSGDRFRGRPPILGVHLPDPLPPEFRRENRDLRVPRREEDPEYTPDFWHIIP